MNQRTLTFSLAEIRNGTGWPRGVRFASEADYRAACDVAENGNARYAQLVAEARNAAGQTTDAMCRDALLRAIGDPAGASLRVPDGLSCDPQAFPFRSTIVTVALGDENVEAKGGPA